MRSRRLLLFIPPIFVLIVVFGLMLSIDMPKDGLAINEDLCPSLNEEIVERAVFLLDLRKPLDSEHVSLPGQLLREVTMDLDANSELQVFALASTSTAPRITLDRSCKPYDDAELAVGGTARGRDCADISDALPAPVRDRASRFCAWRDALQGRLDGLVVQQQGAPVENAYLVEAIEDTILEFSEFSGRHSLYIFSDMMQHATWHSQPETGVEYAGPGDQGDVEASFAPLLRTVDDLRIKVFYVPRRGVTEDVETKADHKEFWRDYFADFAATGVEFEDQPLMSAYEVESLASAPTEIELAALEREQLRLEREQIELALAKVEQERAALEEARQLAAEERQARQARETELRQQQELVQAREAEREAERQRLQAERLRLETERAEVERRETEALADQRAQDALPEESTVQSEPSEAASTRPPRSIAARTPEPTPDTTREEPFHGTNVSGERQRPGTIAPWSTSGAGPQAKPKAPAVGHSPERSVDQAQTASVPCVAQLKPEYATGADSYPGGRRVNYGGAVITVRYALNAEGETVDEETAVVGDSSNATRPRFLDALARDTVELVKGWEFEVTQGSACAMSQVHTAIFRYRSKCVGAPVPKCRTVQSDVTLMTGS